MKISTPVLVEKYLFSLSTRGLTEKSIKQAGSAMEIFLLFLSGEKGKDDLREVVKKDVEDFSLFLRERTKPKATKEAQGKGKEPVSVSYKNRILSTVKQLFSFLACEQYIISDIGQEIPLFREEERVPRDILSEEEVRVFFEAIETKSLAGKRDYCLLKLMYHTGMRKGEASNLELRDMDFEGDTLLVREGKGRKDRTVPFGKKIQQTLKGYLKNVRPLLVKNNPGQALVFTTNQGRRFSKNVISQMVVKYTKKAGISKHITAHSLRHTFAGHLLKRGADIRHIQEILGHEDLSTTQIYTEVVIKDLQEVYEKTHPRAGV